MPTQIDSTHLLKRGKTYSLRLVIPKHLRVYHGGRREIVKALGTSCLRTAAMLRDEAVAEMMSMERRPHDRTPGLATVAEPHKAYGAQPRRGMSPMERGIRARPAGAPHKAQSQPDHWSGETPPTASSLPNSAGKRVSEASHEWLTMSDGVTLATKERYRRALRELEVFTDDAVVDMLDRQTALAFLGHLRGTPSDRTGRPRSTKTISALMAVLSSFWKVCRHLGYVDQEQANPFNGTMSRLPGKKRQKVATKDLRPVTRKDAEGLLGAIRERKDRLKYPTEMEAITRLLWSTGCRLNEICSLRRDQIEDMGDHLRFRLMGTKSEAGDRLVMVVAPEDVALLREAIAVSLKVQPDHPDNADLLFPRLRRGGADRKPSWMVSKAFGSLRQAAFPGALWDMHSFRRSAVAALINAGVPREIRNLVIGHSNEDDLGLSVYAKRGIYLDKPMKNHTLMQTIARANRSFPGKEAGFIVDYVGVFRNLQKALAIYGGGNTGATEPPIRDKTELIEYLRHMLATTLGYLAEKGVDPRAIRQAQGLEKIALMDAAVDKLMGTDEAKRDYLSRARAVSRVYKAILPDPASSEFSADVVLISVLAERIRSFMGKPNIKAIMQDVEDLLDRSVAPVPYETPQNPEIIDISAVDFEALQAQFNQGNKRTEAERLRALLTQKLSAMVAANPTRADFLDRFQKLIESYNSGSQNIEAFFAALVKLANDLAEEERDTVREGLSEEEKALFDILTKPEPELSQTERERVKAVARSLLETLKTEKLVLDWTKKEQARGAVRQAIELALDRELPDAYDEALFTRKCDTLYRHVFEVYHAGPQGPRAAA